MKNLSFILFLLSFLLVEMIFVSCSSSDDYVSPDNLASILQQNKWTKRDASFHEGSGNHAWMYDITETLYFTTEDSGIAYIETKDIDTELGNSRNTEWYMFTYHISGNSVIVTDESSNVTNYAYVSGKLINGDDMYESSSLTYGDKEILQEIGPKTGQCGSCLKYSIDERKGIITISGNGDMYNYDNGNTPWKNYNFHKLIVNEGCTSIGNYAFYGCDLTDVDLCNSLKRIGDGALRATNISKVNVPTELQTIGKYAFAECGSLRDVNFAGCDDLTIIDEAAFWRSKVDFGYFTMPKNLNTIGNFAFCNSTFKSLTLNDKLTSIGGGAFKNLKLTKLVIPNSVTYIGNFAFWGSFSQIRIGTGLTRIQGTPFASSSYGSMYVTTTSPCFFPEDSYNYLIGDNSGANAVPKWSLYVPKGCKSNYSKNAVWGKFRSINEDASL